MIKRFTLAQVGSKAYLHSCVKLKPYAGITFNQKSCDCCRPVECTWYYSNAEIGNVEEPKVEYESVTYSLLWSWLYWSWRSSIKEKEKLLKKSGIAEIVLQKADGWDCTVLSIISQGFDIYVLRRWFYGNRYECRYGYRYILTSCLETGTVLWVFHE